MRDRTREDLSNLSKDTREADKLCSVASARRLVNQRNEQQFTVKCVTDVSIQVLVNKPAQDNVRIFLQKKRCGSDFLDGLF